MVEGRDLEKYDRVSVDQDICIECGSCIAVCPFHAFEYDTKNKARLIWDKCQDDFSCVAICPVSCIYKASETPQEVKNKNGWLRMEKTLNPEETEIFDNWKKRFQITISI